MKVQGGTSGWLNSEYSGDHSLAAISEPSNDRFRGESSDSSNGAESMRKESGAGEKSAQKGSSALMKSEHFNQSTILEPIWRSRETFEDESYESDSASDGSKSVSSSEGSVSEYSTESESSFGASEESSNSTSGTPIPSTPLSANPRNRSSPHQNSLSGALQGQDDSLAWGKVMSKEEHNVMAHSEAWAAIAEANKTNVSGEVKGATDAAEWAIARSLSALQVASVASPPSGSASVLPLRDDMSSSSEESEGTAEV